MGATVARFCFMAKYLDDILILSGLILLGVGLWLLHPPLALIILGAILLLIGLVAAWRKGTR